MCVFGRTTNPLSVLGLLLWVILKFYSNLCYVDGPAGSTKAVVG